jgi:hypothetical protein
MKNILTTCALLATLALAGCGSPASETPAKEAPAKNDAALPEGLFLDKAPADAKPVSEARADAKAGDDITVSGYIGGRVEPFTAGRAIFTLADTEKAPACADECKTPWDACCTSGDTIAANSATVQVVDADGKLIATDLNGIHGLKPGAPVTVTGKVREANENILIVDATGLAVDAA